MIGIRNYSMANYQISKNSTAFKAGNKKLIQGVCALASPAVLGTAYILVNGKPEPFTVPHIMPSVMPADIIGAFGLGGTGGMAVAKDVATDSTNNKIKK